MPLIAVENDPNNAGGGELIADNPQTVFINSIPVIEHEDPAKPDSVCPASPHCNPATAEGSPNVFVYGNPIHRIDDDRVCGHKTVPAGNTTVYANEGGPASSGGSVIDGVYIYDDPAGGKFALEEAEGAHSPFDDAVEGGGDPYPGATAPGGQQGEIGDPTASDDGAPGAAPPPLSVGCQDISGVNYNYLLSSNYALRDFSTRAKFPHSIRAQGGRSTSQIICNLKALVANITEPLRARYPGFRINSGFRRGAGTGSQHEKGMAMDVQWPGKAPRDYLPIAQWCKNNLNYDQLIFEHGNSIWIHLSYDREKSKQRRQVLTYYKGKYSSGLKLYY